MADAVAVELRKQATRDQVMAYLESKGCKVSTTEQFGLNDGGIWVQSTEDQPKFFKYHAWEIDPQEKAFTNGVILEIAEMVDKGGWWFEWYDSGTLMVWN